MTKCKSNPRSGPVTTEAKLAAKETRSKERLDARKQRKKDKRMKAQKQAKKVKDKALKEALIKKIEEKIMRKRLRPEKQKKEKSILTQQKELISKHHLNAAGVADLNTGTVKLFTEILEANAVMHKDTGRRVNTVKISLLANTRHLQLLALSGAIENIGRNFMKEAKKEFLKPGYIFKKELRQKASLEACGRLSDGVEGQNLQMFSHIGKLYKTEPERLVGHGKKRRHGEQTILPSSSHVAKHLQVKYIN